MKLSLLFSCGVAFGVVLAGCSADPGSLDGLGGDEGDGTQQQGGGDGTTTPAALQCTDAPQGRSYTGFGKTDLTKDRVNEATGLNRARVKPYAVLSSEFQRTIGSTPSSLAGEADTFGAPDDRWYDEAELNAVSMSTAYSVSFEGCLTYTQAPAEFAAAPTQQTADAQCAAMMKKFWDKTASPDEVAACSKFATTGVAKEPDARRKWAYVCASILTSTRFLTF